MAVRIGDAWGSIRGVIREPLSFSQIKDLVGNAGLPIYKLSHLQQSGTGYTSKGQLMDAVDGLFNNIDEDAQDRFVIACVESLSKRSDSYLENIRTTLGRLGWGVTPSGGVYPLRLQIELETSKLSDRIQEGIDKTLRRYRDGDFDGAMTSICGVVDAITENIYSKYQLEKHSVASYQEKVAKAYRALEEEYKKPLSNLGEEEIKLIWENHYKAVNQAGCVLGTFRRKYSDVHGAQKAAPQLVQRAIDCAVFIIRSMAGLL